MKTTRRVYRLIGMAVAALVFGAAAWGQTVQNIIGTVRSELPKNNSSTQITCDSEGTITNGTVKENVYDGNTSSYFRIVNPITENLSQLSITFDFGSPQKLNGMRVLWGTNESSRPTEVEVQTKDGENWNTVQTYSNLPSDIRTYTYIFDSEIEAQEIRLLMTPRGNASDKYISIYEITFFFSAYTLQHKAGFWYSGDYQRKFPRDTPSNDRFVDGEGFDEKKRQQAHEYREVIYVQPGQTIDLWVPSQGRDSGTDNGFNYKYYQRWYDYETDGAVAELVPLGSNYNSGEDTGRGYYLSDGLYGGNFWDNTNNKYLWHVRYHVPEDFDGITIACDASRYTDGALEGTHYIEPTLSKRCIFEIHNAADLKLSTDDYLEKYTIHFPTTRIGHTDEVLALAMNARNYIAPGQSGTFSLKITKEGDDNDEIITSLTESIEGENRVIRFNTPKEVSNGATVKINVTNGDYKVAQYTLIFDKYTHGIPLEKVEEIEEGEEEGNLYFRTSPYFRENNYERLNKIDFEYKTYDNTGGYYPYPTSWTFTTYGFFNGGGEGRYSESSPLPQSAEYAFLGNVGSDGKPRPELTTLYYDNEQSNYHLYVDASDKPGTIVKAILPGNLCPGATLYVTAWIKNQGWGAWGNNPAVDGTAEAGLVFILKGVKEDGTETELYRHASGQIPRDNPTKSRWHQIYFSYINGNGEDAYKQYLLQIDNNCASSSGGDIALDDIRIYMAKPQGKVKQLDATCGTVRTRLNLSINWEQLMSRMTANGVQSDIFPSKDGKKYSAIGICFVDRDKYDATKSIEKSVVEIGSNIETPSGSNNYKYAAMFYWLDYENHPSYDDKAKEGTGFTDGALAMNNDWFFYQKEENGEQTLTVDFYADLQPYKRYTMIIVSDLPDGNETIADIRNALAEHPERFNVINDQCAIHSDVWVTSESLIKVNGSVLNPNLTYCAGQILNFAVQLQAPSEEGGMENIEQEVYYDWFFGTKDDYEDVNETDKVSLADALTAFRNEYPDATSLEGVTAKGDLTNGHIEIIRHYLDATSANDINAQLVLHRENLNIQLAKGGLSLVVCPIAVELDNQDVKVCTDPVFLELKTSGESPVAHVGFSGVAYSEEPNVRIGLTQIKGATDANSSLKIDLREIKLVNENGGQLGKMDSNPYVYLVGSTDPTLKGRFDKIESDPLSLPIGNLHEFSADRTGSDFIRISFDLDGTLAQAENNDFRFDPKEGYEYSLRVYFQESGGGSTSGSRSICEGILTFTMKVVPEYMHWTGLATGNWNNDGNWVRSKADDINNPDEYSDYSTPYEHKGFVPMRFTKVVIPTENKQIELYDATSSDRILDLSERPASITQNATALIEYDMMVKSADGSPSNYNFDCEPYYTNTVSEIHFEPNTEMLHTELLKYTKAWVDYELTKGRWYTLASPLQGVVAGDFYTDKDGREGQAYFSDIKYDPKSNSRFSPSVYQRGWKGSATLQTLNNGTKDVAIEGNWSSVYNDVLEKYIPGNGFSLNVQNVNENTALFRLPKNDNFYTYYNKDGKEDGYTANVPEESRAGAGLLKSDELKSDATEFSVSLGESANGEYYLVGNPFMAHLDAEKFFEANATILESKYWLVTNNNQSVAVGDESGWVIVGENNKPLIAPLQSFFVQKKTGVAVDATITFTADMQTLATETTGSGVSTNTLLLTVSDAAGRQSRAAVSYDAAASEGYKASEDAELFLDSNLGNVPMVYTAAGTMAASINRTSGLYNIPVGVYAPGAEGETVSLTFSGTDGFSYATLYDAKTRIDSPIREGSSFTIPANTAGRYFLRAGVPTANEAVQESAIRIYTVGSRTLVVASTDLLRTVRVYDFAGRLVANETGLRTTQCRIELPQGTYIVKAESENGEEEAKVRM